jgi:energy coupling factor transporter S component ThiW
LEIFFINFEESWMKARELARAIVLVAVAVVLSPFFIPVGIAKCFPAQHMVNVLSAVMLGPAYAVVVATVAAIVRNMLGLGTLLAFPGGIFGALLAGLAYRIFRNNIYFAGIGEVVGTGIIGSLVSVWLVAPMLMGKTMALSTLIVAFSVSSLGGAVLGLLVLQLLRKGGIWQP